MTPARLRLRVLTILGLPALACSKQAPAVADDEPTVLEIPPVASATGGSVAVDDELDQELFTHPAARAFDCGRDRTRAFVCGQAYGTPEKTGKRPYEQCSTTVASVSREVTAGHISGAAELDTALTARLREHDKNSTNKSCCYSACVDVKSRSASAPTPTGFRTIQQCFVGMRRGTQHPAPGRDDCPIAVDFGSGPDGSYAAPFHEESSKSRTSWVQARTGFNEVNLCCYQDAVRIRRPVRGRVLRDAAGEMVVAPLREFGGWQARIGDVDVDGLGNRERDWAARRWMRDAELEHASVASFARLALALMACGAPPDLCADAHASALDEIRHAQLCFALASRYAGTPVGPGPLAVPASPTADVVALAVETFRDGCIGETAAALVASRSAQVCEQPAVAAMLREIARDEQRHAELAWRIVQWTLTFDGVRAALLAEQQRLLESTRRSADQAALNEHGLLSAAQESQIAGEVLQQVVLPCVGALLAA